MPEPTSEAWVQIRHDYEHTDRPLAHICAEHNVTIPTVRYRMKRWEWRRRKPLIPRQGPPPVEKPPSADTFPHPPLEGKGRWFERERKPAGWGEGGEFAEHPTPLRLADASRSDPPPPGEGEENTPVAIVPRLQAAAARLMPAIEVAIARLASGKLNSHELEKTGRALGTLMRTLRELNALLVQHNAPLQPDDDPVPQDMDEFRYEVARRIRSFIAARKNEQDAQPGQAAGPAAAVDGPARA